MKINVAITLDLKNDPQQSIWFNGGNQHCVFLYMTLKQSPWVGQVWLVHGDQVRQLPKEMYLNPFRNDVCPLSKVIDNTHLLIEMGAFISQEHVAKIRSKRGKVVSYRYGNDYVNAVETISFGTHDWRPNPLRIAFDEIWTNPQHANTCLGYFKAIYHAPVHVLPHLWAPYFVDKGLEQYAQLRNEWGYRNRGSAKRIAVFEPNLNVVKSSLLPILAVDDCYRRVPELISHLYMTNTYDKRENVAFKHIALGLKIVQDGKASADQRFPFFAFAAEHTDIVISHQWENGLNYLFYDALYGGYPLVHNSPFLRGKAGYYYPDFDVEGASSVLEQVLKIHDHQVDAYRRAGLQFLAHLHPTDPLVQQAYTQRIADLFALG